MESNGDPTNKPAGGTSGDAAARPAPPPPSFDDQLKLLVGAVPGSGRPKSAMTGLRRISTPPAGGAPPNKSAQPETLMDYNPNGSGDRRPSGFTPPAGVVYVSGRNPSKPQLRSRNPAGKSLVIQPSGVKTRLSMEIQDLSRDEFIVNAPRKQFEGRSVPALGGIPLLNRLGQGGMGAVYFGLHPGFGTEVAVKVLPFHLAQRDPSMVKRFFREARLATSVHSDHLVRVTDVAEENGISYLVMEYVSGSSAGQLLKQARLDGKIGLPEGDALEICIAACQGLVDAHAAQVVHRDMKPDNILVPVGSAPLTSNFSGAKVADLGLARHEEQSHSMTASNACLGTPGFMAPEQIEKAHAAGKPADVYGLGACLYALLCGEPPFVGGVVVAIMRDTLRAAHRPVRDRRPDVSKSTSTLIDLCLAKDPTHRYQDADALLRALRACRQALNDPHAAQYLDITRPLLNRQSAESAPSEAVAKVSRRRLPRWLYAAALIVLPLSIVGMAAAWLPAQKPSASSTPRLAPSAKQLMESENKNDALVLEAERVKRQGLEKANEKLLELERNRQKALDAKRAQTENIERSFEYLMARANEAVKRNEWITAQALVSEAATKPEAHSSLMAAQFQEFEKAVRERAVQASDPQLHQATR